MKHFGSYAPSSHSFLRSLGGGVKKQLMSFTIRQQQLHQLSSSSCKSSRRGRLRRERVRCRAAGFAETLKVCDLHLTCWWMREGSELREPLGGSRSGLDTSQVEVLPVDTQDVYLGVNFTPVSFCTPHLFAYLGMIIIKTDLYLKQDFVMLFYASSHDSGTL